MRKMLIERTKKDFPCLWEAGGGYTNTGEATIITDKDGQAKKAIYIRNRGPLANSEHALIPIEVGDFVIEANHHREDFEIFVYKITEILEKEVVLEQTNYFEKNEWDAELPEHLEDAVEAAMKKATCYHCRKPHFIKIDEE